MNNTSRLESAKKKVTFSIGTDQHDFNSKVLKGTDNVLPQTEGKHSEFPKKQALNHKKAGILVNPKNCGTKVCDVKKTLVRNVEQTLPPQCMLIKKKQCSTVTVDFYDNKEIQATGTKSTYKSKYAAPELYTTLCIAKEIQNTSVETSSKHLNLPQDTKQMLDEKVIVIINLTIQICSITWLKAVFI